jgi:putative SOS response-associated peptidase YedK
LIKTRNEKVIDMCGRFTLVADPEAIMDRFGVDSVPFEITRKYNIAPTTNIAVIHEISGERKASLMRWGLVPFWASDIKIGARMINARAETILEKPAFKRLVANKRIMVISDGFYEWKKTKDGKQPIRIMMKDGALFGMAGLYDSWKSPSGEIIHSCTIITTRPNEIMESIHDRMPSILKPEDENVWLSSDETDPVFLQSIALEPFPAEDMKAYPVHPMVGSPKNDVKECIEPFA